MYTNRVIGAAFCQPKLIRLSSSERHVLLNVLCVNIYCVPERLLTLQIQLCYAVINLIIILLAANFKAKRDSV